MPIRPAPLDRKHLFVVAALLSFFTTEHIASSQNAPAQPLLDAAAYEQFALKENGDATRGQAVFTRATCVLCHTVDGTGKLAGPDLFAIGDKFARRDLIRSVLEPSAAIAIGYETSTIEKKSGEVLLGVVKGAGDGWTEIMGADGKRVRVEATEVARRGSLPQSL